MGSRQRDNQAIHDHRMSVAILLITFTRRRRLQPSVQLKDQSVGVISVVSRLPPRDLIIHQFLRLYPAVHAHGSFPSPYSFPTLPTLSEFFSALVNHTDEPQLDEIRAVCSTAAPLIYPQCLLPPSSSIPTSPLASPFIPNLALMYISASHTPSWSQTRRSDLEQTCCPASFPTPPVSSAALLLSRPAPPGNQPRHHWRSLFPVRYHQKLLLRSHNACVAVREVTLHVAARVFGLQSDFSSLHSHPRLYGPS